MPTTKSGKERTLKSGIPDEHYQLIGQMITEWSRLETILGTLIWHFLKLDMEDGRVVTATLDTRPKVRMLRQLAKRHIESKAIKHQFSELLEVVEGVQEDRNFIAHGLWGTAMPDNLPAASSLRPKSHPFHVVTEAFPPGRMRELVSIIRELADVLGELPDALSTSQKKHDARLHLLRASRKLTPTDPTP
ncbi:MAG: hypothetical protein MN733_42095 [Nitrososphaera sp.]|nr:hypothetical protein [Nitrososphaera sp.]